MIWTDDENIERGFDTMLNSKGKSCNNCLWAMKGKSGWVTCGYHQDNFTTKSLCGYWTDQNDQKVKEYYDNRKKELKEKLKLKQS